MNRLAAIYDIHANLPALQAAIEEIRASDVDMIVVGGDVLPGPMPEESLALLTEIEIPVRFLLGNGDREVLARLEGRETPWYESAREEWREPVRWTAEQLTEEHREFLASWPPLFRTSVGDIGPVLFCHATPRNDTDCFTRLTDEERLLPLFDGNEERLVVCGHTHMQFDRMVGRTRVVNAGSIGMPYGEPGAYWLLLGPEVDLRRTPYDMVAAAQRVRSTHYPRANEFAENTILHPPTEKQMLGLFAGAEL